MKKQILFIGTFLISAMGLSQTLYTSDGSLAGHRKVTLGGRNLTFTPATSNSEFFIHGGTGFVGIGKLNPTSMLDVDGQIIAVGASFPKSIPNGTVFANVDEELKSTNVLSAGTVVNTLNNTKTFNFFDQQSTPTRVNPSFWFSLQNRNDIARFVVSASQGGSGALTLYDKNEAEVFRVLDYGNESIILQMPKPNTRVVIGDYSSYTPSLVHKFCVKGGSALIEGNILTDSNIGIGTSNFVDGPDTYRLSVDGAIRANRVKVYTTWADYVFEKDYGLPTLEEVEKHIIEKGHLKDIPSAKDVEQNGIELGEMNKLLLQKVEELTLYIIEMNKELQVVKSQIKDN
ncbi:hypothetical protein J2X31_001681 [Flavobacterium arsenatis]|uniref:Chaperone of endosialidase n=1 Tax=Flavobacterium arsenatis TaxID=1484332 RepID=A0ABU1TNX5_9FLAO|nr:hypothetical protein [Flavobacterium arsenatis]MDR6967669.1 hypothetical protein [Flavobacterium arsenatis]